MRRILGKKSALVCFCILLASCTSYKKVPYMQNSEEFGKLQQVVDMYEARIQPRDILTITVATPTNPSAAAPYNLTVPNVYGEQNRSITSQPTLQNYIVDNEGMVNFPGTGKIVLSGMTKEEAEQFITNKIKANFTETPIVTIRFTNYKISVLGEVNAPGSFTIPNEKVNIFEALALAKDMSIYGCRDNVKIIREDSEGQKTIHELNLNDVNVICSPYYYLHQNDVVYVTPNKSKAKNSDVGTSTTLWFSATSILISLTSLLYNILN